MAKKEIQPQYIPSDLNTPMLNYRVYYMSKQESLLNHLLAFAVGGIVGITFYGGQFRDSEGAATMATSICNLIVFLLAGFVGIKVYIPMKLKQLHAKRKSQLTLQFRSLLESLAVALSSGMNMNDALVCARDDLKTEYAEDSYIVHEVQEMIAGMNNNIPIEKMLASLGERSEIDDIKNFGTVFSVSYRAGGNLKDIVRRTNGIISEKIEIREQIETAITSNKSQFSVMMVIPVVLVLLLRMMSSSFAAAFATVTGVVAMTVAVGVFVGAYKLGEKIMDVKG